MAEIAGRAGFVADRALIYVKGGAAWINSREDFVETTTLLTANGTYTPVGGLLGAGVEYAFAPNCSAKLEYDYIDLGNNALNVIASTGVPVSFNIRETISEVKFAVNYRFNFGGPIAAAH